MPPEKKLSCQLWILTFTSFFKRSLISFEVSVFSQKNLPLIRNKKKERKKKAGGEDTPEQV